MELEAPAYSLRSCVPSYSSLPLEDEETVEYNPRPGNSPSPQGTFVRKWSHVTLILKDQQPDVRLPTYGRHGVISGELGLDNTEKVLEVKIKFEGRTNLSVSDSGTSMGIIVSHTTVLWTGDRLGEKKCPTILPFNMRFPLTYNSDGKSYRLPPSFEATFLGIPALFARCTYTLTITITRLWQYRLASWSTSKAYATLIAYRPRTKPYRPLPQYGSIVSSIKPVPDEWLQLITTVKARSGSKLKPIDCHFVIPSVQTFCLTERIPFHIQLCSTLESLRELLPSTSSLLKPPAPHDPQKPKWPTDDQSGASAIRVYIARQVVVEIQGRRRFRTNTLGSGKLHPVPPVMTKPTEAIADPSQDEVSVDWEGEIQCWGEVPTGGFSARDLLVKDFIVLALTPTKARSSPLLPLQLAHPIKLVTDPWADDSMHPHDT